MIALLGRVPMSAHQSAQPFDSVDLMHARACGGPYALAVHHARCFCKHPGLLTGVRQARRHAKSATTLPEGHPAAYLVSKLLLAHRLQCAHMINKAKPGCLPSSPYAARPELVLV